MTKLPDFEAWAVFAKIAEAGSFARAASELGIGKPTVSKALTRLEQRLGATLFHRTSRRLSLTQIGHAALPRATAILAEGEAIEAEAAAQSSAPHGLVRLAAPLSFGLRHLGPALADFLAACPDVTVDLNLSDARLDLVAEGFDLALRIAALPDSTLLARRLCPVRVLLVGAPAYFARHGMPAHPRDLVNHVGFTYAHRGHREPWRFEHNEYGEAAVAIPSLLRTNNADVLAPLLAAGMGLALQPDFMVTDELRAGTLQVAMPEWRQRAVALHLVTPPSPLRPARVRALMDFLTKRFASVVNG